MVSLGDEMDYNLVRPNYDDGQNYKMSQKEAYNNLSLHMKNIKINDCTSPKLVQTVPLKNGSICVHTAHDDKMYFHHLGFSPEAMPRNGVRLVLVFRWLAVPTFFWQSHNDKRCQGYGTVNKHAFERLKNFGTADMCWNALGYIDADGNHIRKQLMDPIIKDE